MAVGRPQWRLHFRPAGKTHTPTSLLLSWARISTSSQISLGGRREEREERREKQGRHIAVHSTQLSAFISCRPEELDEPVEAHYLLLMQNFLLFRPRAPLERRASSGGRHFRRPTWLSSGIQRNANNNKNRNNNEVYCCRWANSIELRNWGEQKLRLIAASGGGRRRGRTAELSLLVS